MHAHVATKPPIQHMRIHSPSRGPSTGPTSVDIIRIPMVKPRLHGGKTSDMEPIPAPLRNRINQHNTPRCWEVWTSTNHDRGT
jgi:hypothetical protein